jgi:hypothetical protein
MSRRLGPLALSCALLSCNGGASKKDIPDVYVPSPADAGGEIESEAAVDGGAFGSNQVDRAGHPLVSILLVPSTLLDPYNAQPSFAPDVPRVLSDALASRLQSLDTLVVGDAGPDPIDWTPDGGVSPLLPVFLSDVLLVDTSLPCTSPDGGFVPSYLALEREIYLSGAHHSTCGGRAPGENVVDETLSLLVTADRDGGPGLTQGVQGPTRPATTTFPYFAGPN